MLHENGLHITADKKLWFIIVRNCANDFVEEGQRIEVPHPIWVFDNLQEWSNKIIELGCDTL